jgi:hypothetical protein
MTSEAVGIMHTWTNGARLERSFCKVPVLHEIMPSSSAQISADLFAFFALTLLHFIAPNGHSLIVRVMAGAKSRRLVFHIHA